MAAPWASDPIVGGSAPARAAAPWASDPVVGDTPARAPATGRPKIDAYLAETDRLLGLPAGTSARQIKQESGFRADAVSPAGARGLAQVMPKTAEALSKRLGRPLDPMNVDDALLMHREVMRENLARFKTPEDALRAYNAGWDRGRWNNPETNNYVRVIAGSGDRQAAAVDAYKRGQVGSVLGLARGFADVGDTLLNAAAKVVPPLRDWNAERRAGLASLDAAQADSGQYSGTRLAGNLLATAPVGGVLGAGARALGAAPSVVNALTSAGFHTGRAAAPVGMTARAGDVALRMAGGGAVGAAAAGIVDPGSTATGGAIGAALPPAVQAVLPVARAAGRAAGAAMRPREVAGAADVARALGAQTPNELAAIVDKLRAAETLVPGAPPTVAQALLSPEASILQRVVHDTPGAARLRDAIARQNAARTAALEGVAPTNAAGLAQAREDLGASIERYVVPEQRRLKDQVSAMYEGIDPADEVRLTLPLGEFDNALKTYLGPGTFGQGATARQAATEARRIGTVELPAVEAVKGARMESLLDAVKRAGGIRENSIPSQVFRGELKDLRQSDLGRVVYKNRGLDIDRMAERMHAQGFIPDEDPATLIDYLRHGARDTFAMSDQAMESAFTAAADRAAGGVPAAERVVQPVTWRQLQSLRSSIGDAWKQAEAKGLTKEAAALNAMKQSLDDAVVGAAGGAGKPGDVMPIDAAERWREANLSFQRLQERFHTGPQASIFRSGGDGQPARQGGEIAGAFWGNRPGLAADVASFRRLVDESPALLGQFRSLITTHGAAGADAAGNLTTKFSRWVEQTLPGLRGAFSPDEVRTLQRIAADIDRAAAAQKLGTSLGGSNTYQNAANALDLGLLDSPLVRRAASAIPGVRVVAEPLVEGLRNSARNAKAERLAAVLADSGAAADAMALLAGRAPVGGITDNELARLLGLAALRAAPRAIPAQNR